MVDIGYDGDELRESRIQALKTSSPAAFLNWRAGRGRSLDRHAPVNASRPADAGARGYPNLWMNLGR